MSDIEKIVNLCGKKSKRKIKKEIMEAITGMQNVPCKNISWQCRL